MPVHCAEQAETVREYCGRSRGGFKPKREVLLKFVVGEQKIGTLLMNAHAATCCPALARELKLPVCISVVRNAGCGGRIEV